MIKTVTLAGAEVRVTGLGGFNTSVHNLGEETIFASAFPNISAEADNVAQIPAGAAKMISTTNGTVYLLGSGKAELTGQDNDSANFKQPSPRVGDGLTKGYVDELAALTLDAAEEYSDSKTQPLENDVEQLRETKADKTEIPSELPSPNSLTLRKVIRGGGGSGRGSSIIYDGSEAAEITINEWSVEASEDGEGLMSAEDKIKLDGIEAGANNYTPSALTLRKVVRGGGGSGRGTPLVYDGSEAAELEINEWSVEASEDGKGLMSAEDKIKLDGIEAGANSYTPSALTLRKVVKGGGGSGRGTPLVYDGSEAAELEINEWSVEASEDGKGLMSAEDKIKLDGIEAGANSYTLPAASSTVLGGIKTNFTQDRANKNFPVKISSSNAYVNIPDATTSYSGLMTAAEKAKLSGIAENANNYTPSALTLKKVIRGGGGSGRGATVVYDGSESAEITINEWSVEASADGEGLMSAEDKVKLDGIAANANNYSHPTASPTTSSATYGTTSTSALTPKVGETFSVPGFTVNSLGHVTAAGSHTVKMPVVTNPNLLDNWYFADPINQRGGASYTDEGYTIDRWKKGSSGTVTVSSSGYVSLSSGTELTQIMEAPVNSANSNIALSVFGYIASGASLKVNFITESGTTISTEYTPALTTSGSAQSVTRSAVYSGSPIKGVKLKASGGTVYIKAVKLEVGTQSTLGSGSTLYDAPPNKALELAKCQRYYQSLNPERLPYAHIVRGMVVAKPNMLVGGVFYKQNMRVPPQSVVKGNFQLWDVTAGNVVTSISEVSLETSNATSFGSFVNVTMANSTTLVSGHIYDLIARNDSTADIGLDAEIY